MPSTANENSMETGASGLADFRQRAVACLSDDERSVAALEAGAGSAGTLDRFFDLDLILVAAAEAKYQERP